MEKGTIVSKLEGKREVTLGFVDLLRDDYIILKKIVAVVSISHKIGSGCTPLRFGGYPRLAHARFNRNLWGRLYSV